MVFPNSDTQPSKCRQPLIPLAPNNPISEKVVVDLSKQLCSRLWCACLLDRHVDMLLPTAKKGRVLVPERSTGARGWDRHIWGHVTQRIGRGVAQYSRWRVATLKGAIQQM